MLVHRGVVREGEVDAARSARGIGRGREGSRAVGLQRLRLRQRAVPDLNLLPTTPQRPHEARAQHAHPEEGDHGPDSNRTP